MSGSEQRNYKIMTETLTKTAVKLSIKENDDFLGHIILHLKIEMASA